MANIKTNNSTEMAEVISRSEAFLTKQKKPLLIVLAAIIVIVGGGLLYHNFVSVPKENKASTALAKGQEYFSQGDWQKALNGDGAGFAGFVNIAKQYSGTDAANLAKLYAGIALYNTGKAEAIGAIGDCYATLGQKDEAVNNFKKAAAKADNNSLSPIYLVKAGEVLESDNKYDEALKLYQEVKDKYVQSAMQQDIDKYIERATVKKQ